jgi:predicted PurR-regulated permease PerM
VLADAFATLGSLLVMLFVLFFMLRDGHVMARHLRRLLPLPEQDCDRLMRDTRDLRGGQRGCRLLVALAQGTIGGVAFWLLRISATGVLGSSDRVLFPDSGRGRRDCLGPDGARAPAVR